MEDLDFWSNSLVNSLFTFLENNSIALMFYLKSDENELVQLIALPSVMYLFLFGFLIELFQKRSLFKANEVLRQIDSEISKERSVLLFSLENRVFKSKDHIHVILKIK